MSVIRCPDCGGLWTIDKPRAGEMLCPRCMTRIPLGGPSTGRTTAAGDDADTAEPPAPPVAPAAAPDLETSFAEPLTPEEAAGSTDGSVVCPRCRLHFHPGRPARTAAPDRPTILVVDDLAYFRQVAVEALEPKFNVRTAATSAEARDALAAGGIDLLVLDLTLDGSDAGRDLLAELTPKPCPILIFTAQDESMYGESWEELQRLGADDLVLKGMKVAESLARKAATLLGIAADAGRGSDRD